MKYEVTAKRIREAMEDKNISQQELADKSKIGKSSISHYVNGTHEPGNKAAYYLANVLEVNPAWLMGLDVPKKPTEDNPTLAEYMGWDSERKFNQLTVYDLIDPNEDKELYELVMAEKFDADIETIKKALKLYALFEKADSKIKAAIEALLKSNE